MEISICWLSKTISQKVQKQFHYKNRKVLVDVFLKFELPEILHSDQRKDIESTLLKQTLDAFSIQKTRTAYHPQGNGVVERFNRLLLQLLRVMRLTGRDIYPSYYWHIALLFIHPPVYLHSSSCLEDNQHSPLFNQPNAKHMTPPLIRHRSCVKWPKCVILWKHNLFSS